MRTNKFVGYCLVLVTVLSILLLLFSVFLDKQSKHEDISNEDNFKELVRAENSFLMFYSKG